MENYLEILANIEKQTDSLNNKLFGIAASKENNDFFSIVSHNLKNTFSTLLGFSDLLFEDYDELNDEERKFYLLETVKSANLTNKYIERFFEWIYYKNGKIKIDLEEINLDNAVNLACKKIKLKLDAENIRIFCNSSITVLADLDSLIKIVYYILENAVVHSESKNDITVNCGLDEKLKFAKIIIKDNGIGIPQDQLEKIFKINEDVTLNSCSKIKGSGLGLILVKQLLDLNKGEISILSELSIGTKVIIKLPLAQNFN